MIIELTHEKPTQHALDDLLPVNAVGVEEGTTPGRTHRNELFSGDFGCCGYFPQRLNHVIAMYYLVH